MKPETSLGNTASAKLNLSGLSVPRQALVRLCQSVDFGQILGLHIRDREPVFSPPPTVLRDIKLDADCGPRQEAELADFALREEVCRLLERIDQIENGRLDRIEVRAGIPRRVLIETKLNEERQ